MLFTVVGCILDLIDVRSSISGIDLNVFAGLLTLRTSLDFSFFF